MRHSKKKALKKIKWTKNMKSEKSSQKDSQGSISPLWVCIIFFLLQICSENWKMGTSENSKNPNPRKAARKTSKGRFYNLFSPDQHRRIEKCAPGKKCQSEISSQEDSQGSVSPLWVRIMAFLVQIGTGESKIGIQYFFSLVERVQKHSIVHFLNGSVSGGAQ